VESLDTALTQKINEVLRDMAATSDAGEEETPLNPKLAAIDKQTRQYQAEIATKIERKALLDREIGNLREFVDASAQVSIEYQKLKDDLALLNGAHLQTQGELAAAREGETLELSGESEAFKVLNEPRRPQRPFRPDLIQSCLMGILAGLALGVGVIALLELFDQSYRSEEQLAADFNLEVLVTVPNLNAAMVQVRQRRAQRSRKRRGEDSHGRRRRRGK
jgi:uncharacterized protein involved in exopolysaccharide biosynthesis